MTIKRLRPSFTFTEERLNELRAVVPEAFADGRVNWEALKEALGEWTEPEGSDAEHFGLFWPGKREARRLAAKPSRGTLVPVPGEGVNEETTRNLFIEGDNLEVLKLLQKSYAGRVKMIYIDPPYNTGNDFVYKDDFRDPLGDYLRKTGQVNEEGEPLTTNTRADGRFHSNWLSMMYPRLRLARTLLRDDGIIFVSIDDTEVANLRLLMNEVFGEERFIEEIVWKNKYGSGALTKGFANVHEYILCYCSGHLANIAAPLDEEQIAEYKNRDGKFATRGGYVTQPLATNSKDARPNLRYPIPYQGREIWPEKQWIWSRDRVERALANDEIVFSEARGKVSVRMKQYLRDENGVMRLGKPVSILSGPFNQEGTKEIKELLGEGVFDFPKPTALISYLFSFVVNDDPTRDGVFLDFFGGSGSSAHAVWKLNEQDGGSRQFISVQLPETANREGYKTIADICKERLRRASKNIKTSRKSADIGFRVLRLSESHFRAWENYDGDSIEQLEACFEEAGTPLRKGWMPDGLVSEVMLLQGFPLDSQIESQSKFSRNTVRLVSSNALSHRLWICLDSRIHNETVSTLNPLPEDVIVCLDSALSDEAKLRLADRCTLETI